MKQWMLNRIGRLLEDLDWSDSIKEMQSGSGGAEFRVESEHWAVVSDGLEVFTTRLTPLRATCCLAPETLVAEITTSAQRNRWRPT